MSPGLWRVDPSSWPGGAWDDGVTWFHSVVTPADDLPIDVAYVRDKVLRVANDDFDNDAIGRWIMAAVELAEHQTSQALMPQTLAITLDRAPSSGLIVLPRFPVTSVLSVGYVDENGDDQSLAASPAEFRVVPSGRKSRAQVLPLDGASWPTTLSQPNAIVVTYEAGYPDGEGIPEAIIAGIGIMVRELYSPTMTPEQLEATLARFWRPAF